MEYTKQLISPNKMIQKFFTVTFKIYRELVTESRPILNASKLKTLASRPAGDDRADSDHDEMMSVVGKARSYHLPLSAARKASVQTLRRCFVF